MFQHLAVTFPVMQFSSPQELDKQHIHYHLLPDSDLHNERSERKWRKEVIISETPKHKSEQEVAGHRRGRFNKYALAGAILASTNSILLGYGELL